MNPKNNRVKNILPTMMSAVPSVADSVRGTLPRWFRRLRKGQTYGVDRKNWKKPRAQRVAEAEARK